MSDQISYSAGYIGPLSEDFAMSKYLNPLIIIGFMLLAAAANAPVAVRVLPELISAANAQGVAPESAPPATVRTINITAEQRHIIKEIVLKAPNVEKAPADVDVTVGSTVPSTVTVQPFPTGRFDKSAPSENAHFFRAGRQSDYRQSGRQQDRGSG